MNKLDMTSIQKARVISAIIKYSDEKGNVVFPNKSLSSLLGKIVSSGNRLDFYLYELNESGVLQYEEIGDEGLAPIIMFSISQHTHDYLEGLLWKINEETNSFQKKINDILTFDPTQLAKEIEQTEKKLSEVKESITKNDLLKPLEEPIRNISSHFNSAKIVSQSYEEIYKNIVRPVQEEGRQGVKTTVKWAIISVVVSVALSWLVTNWNKVSEIISAIN